MGLRALVLVVLAGCAGGQLEAETPSVSGLSARLHDELGSVVYVSFSQDLEADSVYVEYTFDEGVVESTPATDGMEGAHEQIVLGVPYGVDLEWSVVSGDTRVGGPVIGTSDAPEGIPRVTLDIADETAWDPASRYLLTTVSEHAAFQTTRPDFWIVLVDRLGRYVWAMPPHPEAVTLYPKISRDGTAILYDESFYWTRWDGGLDGVVRRIRLDGTEERVWATPGLAHSFDDLSADSIAWFETSAWEGDTLELSEGDAAPRQIWDCTGWVNSSDLAAGSCGVNAMFYNEAWDTFTFSLWSHETVIEWDAGTGEVLWYSDPHGGHGYEVSPTEAHWLWQHEARLLEHDRLLLSSGVDEQWDGSFAATAAYEYAIDHDAGTMELVWSYEAEPEFAARYKGGVDRLAGGNTLHGYGNAAAVKEITPEGEVVWQARFQSDDEAWLGRAEWIDDLYTLVP